MIIRLEEENDYFEVEKLTREAFWNVYRPGCFEHLVVHKIRDDKSFVKELDYVIETNGKIIANIVYATGKIVSNNKKSQKVLIFGPVSVLPKYQHQGYGDKLIRFTLGKAKSLGYPLVLITGNPDYYKKFGFEPASNHEIFYKGLSKEEDSSFFMVKILDTKKANQITGTYSDPEVYNVDTVELNDFDKKFPIKTKETKANHLQ